MVALVLMWGGADSTILLTEYYLHSRLERYENGWIDVGQTACVFVDTDL